MVQIHLAQLIAYRQLETSYRITIVREWPQLFSLGTCAKAKKRSRDKYLQVDFVSREDLYEQGSDRPEDRSGLAVVIISDDGIRYYGSRLCQVQTA